MKLRSKITLSVFLLAAIVLSSIPLQPSANAGGPDKPVLAFFYTWYEPSDWGSGKMADQPAQQYRSADPATIQRQVNEASGAGIDGFIASWWGPGDRTDAGFQNVLNASQGKNFYSTVYFETTSWMFGDQSKIINALNYVKDKYSGNPNFLTYQGKPVIFFWDVKSVPRAGGQSAQAAWAAIRQQVDPGRNMIWSAETTDMSYLDVFDGIHLFSACTWSKNLAASNKGFRDKVSAYNSSHGTTKIWAAGVAPGYDDLRMNRPGSFAVDRRDGGYYQESFNAAIASSPEWITITSFNEWFEGSQIEPSQSYGSKYLDLTRQLVNSYKAGPAPNLGSAIDRTWKRTDGPVASQSASRTWMWGPEAFGAGNEQYDNSPGGARFVQYYDKSRMEVNNPNGDQNSKWYVTNGLLVSEMINGRIQVGDNNFATSSAAQVPVAGDPNDTNGPTYASFAGLQGLGARPAGSEIQEKVDRSGNVSFDPNLRGPKTAYHVPETNHAVADVFWDFLNSNGTVDEGRLVNGRLFDPVFYATGFPITEAYWTKVKVNGEEKDVLVQAFERRVLTYTPTNPAGWKVEMGNVGRHYHTWRYGN